TRLASQAQTHAATLGIRWFSAAALSSRRRWLSFRSPRPIRLRSPIQHLSHRWRRASAGPSLSTWPRRAPLVLLLDDLHWADTTSLDLLLYLARHQDDAHILIVGTYRDVELGRQHPLQGTLREMIRERRAEEVTR